MTALSKFYITETNTTKFSKYKQFLKFIIYVRGVHCDYSFRTSKTLNTPLFSLFHILCILWDTEEG